MAAQNSYYKKSYLKGNVIGKFEYHMYVAAYTNARNIGRKIIFNIPNLSSSCQ